MKTKMKTIHSLSRKEKKKNKQLSNKIIRQQNIKMHWGQHYEDEELRQKIKTYSEEDKY